MVQVKYLMIGVLVACLFISGFAMFYSNFKTDQAGYTTTPTQGSYEANLSKVDDAIDQINEFDDMVADESNESTGSWDWNPLDWKIFRAFNVIKAFRNIINVPKEILLALPELFGIPSTFVFVGTGVIIALLIFAIVAAFTRSGRI